MHLREFLRSGHTPSLLSAFLYFDVSFMVWVLVGALANHIAPELGLNDAERGMMVAVPLLGGAVLRIVLGFLTDHIGARRTGMIGLTLTVLPLLLGGLWADSFPKVVCVGLLLGVAGASFAAALPLASRWYPPQYQGLAMGIAGAGNSGTALATLLGPRLADLVGWQNVLLLAAVPVVLTLGVFTLLAKDSPQQPPPKTLWDYAAALRTPDAWWFCILYSVTFGGFVGLASYLNSFYRLQYGLSPVAAGNYATICVIAGSLLRPVGGYLADRWGGIRMLLVVYVGAGLAMLGIAGTPPLLLATVLMFAGMGLLGMGNGAVFQLVPQRFVQQIGVVTGLVGAAGGIGGFVLPNLLGTVRHLSGGFAWGFASFAVIGCLGAAGVLMYVSRIWETTFVQRGGLAMIPGHESDPAMATVPAAATVPVAATAPATATAPSAGWEGATP